MHKPGYKALLYFIGMVILITFSIQLYWNYKNFQSAKRQLINEVQISLDNAIDSYYVDLADRNTIGLTLKNGGDITKNSQLDSLYKYLDHSKKDLISSIDSIDPKKIAGFKILKGSILTDTSNSALRNFAGGKVSGTVKDSLLNNVKKINPSKDNYFNLASKVIISITTDTLETSGLNSFIDEQLQQKNIDIDYGYVFKNNSGDVQAYNQGISEKKSLATNSKSAYLPKNSSFNFHFIPNTGLILKRNMLGLLLSAILIVCVIGCLLFLLHIINRQKQLAEMKNDLISNITHEFKTPISVINVALEGMRNFNKENDPKKNKSYLNTSEEQLHRLNVMVEKLLETALLEGNQIELNKSYFFIDELIAKLVHKYQQLETMKNISFESQSQNIEIYGDAFHLENAFNNIIDNAVKYGGETIDVSLVNTKDRLTIEVMDSGNSLTTEQQKHIFDKFYRVPKGNTHDVKGYGIGLFYTKNIIEEHHGKIELFVSKNTVFRINLHHG